MLVVWALAPPASLAALGCDKVASTMGQDDAAGSEADPYRSVQRLANSLSPGQTGCLRQGNYVEDVALRSGGVPAAPLTIQSFPGERATVVGRLYVAAGADFVVIAGLDLDG